MAADIKTKYPVTSTVALTITLASLASDTNLLAGRQSTPVDNTTNLDLDHKLSGVIMTGTTPTVSTTIEIWIFAPRKVVTGTPTYPDSFSTADANRSSTSANVKYSAMKLAAVITVDATSNRAYDIAPISIAQLFGGTLPEFWGVWVVHNTAAALNATGGNHELHYERVIAQTT
jgi:hypothetical protein